MPELEQSSHDMASDESGAAGYQTVHKGGSYEVRRYAVDRLRFNRCWSKNGKCFANAIDRVAHHFLGQLGIHRKRKKLAHLSVRNREIACRVSEMTIRLETRKRDGIMNRRRYAALAECFLQCIAIGNANYIEVIDRQRVRGFRRRGHSLDFDQQFGIQTGIASTRFAPRIEVW